METTLEVRWFGPDRVPDVLTLRFDDLGAPGPTERTDTYLALIGNDTLGVKLRDGGTAFEIKLRLAGFGHPSLPSTPAGNVERWQKWSFPITDAACQARALGLPVGSLVDVEKRRRLLTYRLDSDGSVAEADERAGDGCSVEITALIVQSGEWWSLGFEAFGDEDRLADALTATAEAFFAGAPVLGEVLAGDASCGYPGWLQTVAVKS